MQFKYLADYQEEIPVIARWYFNEWGHRVEENSAEELNQKLHQYLNRDKIPCIRLAIDSDNKSIAGVAQLKFYEMDIYPERKHWLGGVFVPIKYRGRNIATDLVNNLSELAQSVGVSTLYLQTEKLDGGLYKRLGWKPLEQVEYKGAHVLVMEKSLVISELSVKSVAHLYYCLVLDL